VATSHFPQSGVATHVLLFAPHLVLLVLFVGVLYSPPPRLVITSGGLGGKVRKREKG